jgi:hypothetical protein
LVKPAVSVPGTKWLGKAFSTAGKNNENEGVRTPAGVI